MRALRVCILLSIIFLSNHTSASESPVITETLKGIIKESALKTARTIFELSLFKDGEPRGEFQGVAAFKAPDRVTFKIFGPLGLTILDLIGKDSTLQIYIPSKEDLYQGNLPKDLWLIFGISEDRYRYVTEETDDYYILYLLDTEENYLSIRAKFYFDKIEMKQRRIDILNNGKLQFRVELNEFSGNFPLHLTLHLPSGISMVIKNKVVRLDEVPPEELFLFKDTEGREIKDIRRILEKRQGEP